MLTYQNTCCALIKQINDSLEKYANNTLKSEDLTIMQSAVLIELDNTQGNTLSLKDLEKKFGVAQPTMLGIVRRLSEKDLVEALKNPEDKRQKLVHLTDSGKKKCRLGYIKMNQTESNILRALSPAEQEQFFNMLQKIRASFQ